MRSVEALRMILILIGFTFSTSFAHSQHFTPRSKTPTYWFGSHAVNGARPGISVGVDYGVLNKVKIKRKVRSGDTLEIPKTRQLLVGAFTAVDWHQRTSTTVLTSLTLEYRKTGRFNLQYFLGGGMGAARSILPNVYTVDGNSVNRRFLSGHTYGHLHHYAGMGYFHKKPATLQYVQFRISMHYLVPYNAFILPMPAAEIRVGIWKKPSE